MFKHEFLEALPLYALDALSGAEKQRFEEHLKRGCEICELELRSFQETAVRLPYALPNSPLPPGLRDQLWNRIQQEPMAVPRASGRLWLAIAAAAVLLLAFAGALWLLQLNQQLTAEQNQVAELQQLLIQQRKEIEWLRDPSVQLALLTGLGSVPHAKGKMLWNPSVSRGMFYANYLPPVSAEKSYQLWVIGDGGPVSAGVFYPGRDGNAVVTITRIAGAAKGALQFAVTIEPRGGVPKPTGSMVLAGKAL
jgi:Anti-sigma-K factor rskA, C-terminal/Putative zinc-finger